MANTKARGKSDSAAQDDLFEIPDFTSTFVNGFAEAGQAYMDGFAKMNAEMVTFWNDRLRQDAEFGRDAASCGNWADFAALQQNWARNATDQYLAEASKLMTLASEMTMRSWAPLNEKTAAEETDKAS